MGVCSSIYKNDVRLDSTNMSHFNRTSFTQVGTGLDAVLPANCTSVTPTLLLSSGYAIPMIGLGVNTNPTITEETVKKAIKLGYRHLDCAWVFKNEKEVGSAIHESIVDGYIKNREELFITSKLWLTFFRPCKIRTALRQTLRSLRTSYLDLYILHAPTPLREDNGIFPRHRTGQFLFSGYGYLEAYRTLEELVYVGFIRSLGLCNFNSKQIENVWNNARIKPAVLQLESHPYFTQEPLINVCKQKNIAVVACTPTAMYPDEINGGQLGNLDFTKDSVVLRIATNYCKTPEQIILRFNIQRNIVCIPQAVSTPPEKNLKVFDFELESQDMTSLINLTSNLRICTMSCLKNHENYPFQDHY